MFWFYPPSCLHHDPAFLWAISDVISVHSRKPLFGYNGRLFQFGNQLLGLLSGRTICEVASLVGCGCFHDHHHGHLRTDG